MDHVPQHDFLYLGPVGQHGNNDLGVLRQLLPGSGVGAAGCQLLYRRLAPVVYPQLMACLQQVLCHRLAHNTQSDKTDFHNK